MSAADSQLSRALEQLTLVEVWDLAPNPDTPPQRAGVVKINPFRPDKHPSFSVTADLKVFKDHAREDVKGGVWRFVQLAQPGWSKREVARYLITRAGMNPDDGGRAPQVRRARSWRGSTSGRSSGQQHSEKKASWLPWPDGVRDRWDEGLVFLRQDVRRRSVIADKRGWPLDVVDALLDMGLISYPRLPWTGSKRGTAFLVQAPELRAGGVTLASCGYHQRWWLNARDGNPAEKKWLYMPTEKPEVDRSDWPVRFPAQKTPPFPFVLGDVTSPRLIVLLEGQWDAITFFYAAGWFGDQFPGGVAVFGIRGNQGAAPFFDEYSKIWASSKVKPVAWVIRDADTAGAAWDPPQTWVPGLSFAERLRAMCSRVVVSRLKNEAGLGKDFNDYWREKRPGPAEIAGMLARLGLMG